jgi:uncharacterized protein (UPF0548 family)
MSGVCWSWSEPTAADIAAFLAVQQGGALSYPERGATRDGQPVRGYNFDHNRVQLGTGAPAYAAACAALHAWTMFPAPWTRIAPANAPLREGQVIAMLAHALGAWWLNACRIVYTIDEAGPVRRHGFAYGTLDAHVEQGEERFCVEQLEDGTVWYDLSAFSRPRFWPVRLAKPLARRLQFRFAHESKAAMQCAVVAAARR